MRWKTIFSEIFPQSDPLRNPVHSTNQAACRLAGPGGGHAGRLCARKVTLPNEAGLTM